MKVGLFLNIFVKEVLNYFISTSRKHLNNFLSSPAPRNWILSFDNTKEIEWLDQKTQRLDVGHTMYSWGIEMVSP